MVLHRKYPLFTFDLDFGINFTRIVAWYPLHHVICVPEKFEVGTSNGLRRYAFTRNILFELLTLTLGSSLYKSTLKLLRPTVTEKCSCQKIHYSTFDLELVVKVTRNVARYPLHHETYAPAQFEVDTFNV